MKTFLLSLAICLFSLFSNAQENRTSFQNIAVVTTSAGMAAQLSWKKGQEDVAYFIVERSFDGIDFTQCGIVFLSEDPNFKDYKFRDRIANTSNGLIYRIGVVTNQKRVFYLPTKKIMSPDTI